MRSPTPKRLDLHLEAEGAEFLVLGALLVEGIDAYKSYAQMPGYDLIATNPARNRSARIQVKSRWATDFDGGFLVNNFECDLIVFVALNRGYRYRKAKNYFSEQKRWKEGPRVLRISCGLG